MSWTLFQEYMLILNQIWPLILLAIPSIRDPNAHYQRKEGGGAKRTDNRILFNTILYKDMTGIQWNAIFPDKSGYLCKGKTAHKWLMIWGREHFFEKLLQSITLLFDVHSELQVKWISIDGTLYKAPLGGELTGRNPTDRGKLGGKRSLCVDENGIVLALVHAGAHVHDCKLLEKTLKALRLLLPADKEIHICLDAGYVGYEELVKSFGFIPHIRPRGEEKKQLKKDPRKQAKRWVVEAAHSQMNQLRSIKIRYEKTAVAHNSLAQLASCIMTIRTIFRIELGEDSFWFNKKAAKSGVPLRTRPIDFTRYDLIGATLRKEALEHDLFSNNPKQVV